MSSMILTSDIVNYLVFRYLQESGFVHSAFTFGFESNVNKTQVDPNSVPPGSLITFIQKGLQYLELEANLDEQDGQVHGNFSMLSPEELITHDIDQLRLLAQERKEEAEGKSRREKGRDRERERERKDDERERTGKDKDRERAGKEETNGPTPMDEDRPSQLPSTSSLEIQKAQVTTLEGHNSEVYICAWSPTEPLLASGSGDSTARIWSLGSGSDSNNKCLVLKHDVKQDKSKDVTTLDWNQDGSLLATGSYDGLARIWSKDGTLKNVLDKHSGPIFALKWNKKGDLLLSGSVDKTAIVWDSKAGDVKQVFDFHTAPTLDVDWRNNSSFATCSTDKLIHVCKLGEAKPVRTFAGHRDEVNAVRWDPQGRLLASCSDDQTTKIWSLSSDKRVYDFTDHTREIYTIRWSPTGPGTANPNLPLLLASASFDTTVKLWDVDCGKCIHTLRQHKEPVYSVAFSPNGKYVATGSFDRCLNVWSVATGALVKTYSGEAGIYEVCWNKEGDRIAACFANKTVSVVDMRM